MVCHSRLDNQSPSPLFARLRPGKMFCPCGSYGKERERENKREGERQREIVRVRERTRVRESQRERVKERKRVRE